MAKTKKTSGNVPSSSERSPYSGRTNRSPSEELLDVVVRSQRGFRELIDSFDRIAFNFSLDGRIQVINRQFADVVGLPFSSIVGHRLEEFIAEPKKEELARALPGFLKTHFWAGIVPVRWKSHPEVRFYDCTLYAVIKAGEVTGVSGLARDISIQREAETRFADLFETLHEGVYIAAPGGELIDVNPAAVRMLGYNNKEELLRQPTEYHFVDAGERIRFLEELKKSGSIRDRQLMLRRKDGSLVRVLNSSVAMRDATGEFVRFQGSLVDITEHEQMERRLREEQEFVRRLVACFPDIIVVLDTQGRYTFVSPRVQEFLGYTPDEYLGASIEERPHTEDRDALLGFFRSLTSGEISFGTLEYRTTHKEGGWRTVRANASPLTNAEGKIIGVVASARDVTESKRLEQQLMQSEKLAAIGQMVSGVAHELNNPLTAILGISDLLQEHATDDASRRQMQVIHKQARKAAELVQGLLMFSRPSMHQRQHVRVAELIARSIELRKADLETRHITVDMDAPADLPPIEADPQHMTQVLVNLLSNAEQAIASASDHGRIAIRVSVRDGRQEVLMDDDGPGILPEIRSKIFDPFFTTHRTSGGSGLGLTICLVIVKEHGGTIEAQSSPEGGARFRILLPSSTEKKSSTQALSRSASRERLKGRSILVVDDEEAIRELVEQGLSRQGAIVHTAQGMEEAWKRMKAHPYDAVLCDFNLDGENGSGLLDRMSGNSGPQAPQFLLMTGELLEADRVAALLKKGARVLQKPFQISALVSMIEELVSASARN